MPRKRSNNAPPDVINLFSTRRTIASRCTRIHIICKINNRFLMWVCRMYYTRSLYYCLRCRSCLTGWTFSGCRQDWGAVYGIPTRLPNVRPSIVELVYYIALRHRHSIIIYCKAVQVQNHIYRTASSQMSSKLCLRRDMNLNGQQYLIWKL
jgi:hypothetical protein